MTITQETTVDRKSPPIKNARQQCIRIKKETNYNLYYDTTPKIGIAKIVICSFNNAVLNILPM